MKRLALFGCLLFLNACFERHMAVYHPITHQAVTAVSLRPVDNLTVYDSEPFELDQHVRAALRQRYLLEVDPTQGQLEVRLVLLDFRRGNLRLIEGTSTRRSLNVFAELVLHDADDTILKTSRLSEQISYEDRDPGDFEQARDQLLFRLAERLVVDLFEN